MDISSLINPTPPSRVSTPSNGVANDAPRKRKRTPPPSRSQQSSQSSQRPRRKRHDPIPIWAIREGDTRTHAPAAAPPPVQQVVEIEDAPEPALEPSITNKAPYDEITRSVCDFIWFNVVDNELVQKALMESPDTQVEIEAKWGQMQDKRSGERLSGVHQTECVVHEMDLGDHIKFISTMSEGQHQKMNKFLNGCVTNAKQASLHRAPLDYKHVKEIDKFFELNQTGFDYLSPATKAILRTFQRQRVRLTRDSKTGQALGKIIKHRIANLHISSPKTEWDYRVSINLEINYPGSVEPLEVAAESGLPQERRKDRMSYTHQQNYQIDLTQVVNEGGVKNHELELELYGDKLLREADKIRRNIPNLYEEVVGTLVNNLRVLSRAMDPHPPP